MWYRFVESWGLYCYVGLYRFVQSEQAMLSPVAQRPPIRLSHRYHIKDIETKRNRKERKRQTPRWTWTKQQPPPQCRQVYRSRASLREVMPCFCLATSNQRTKWRNVNTCAYMYTSMRASSPTSIHAKHRHENVCYMFLYEYTCVWYSVFKHNISKTRISAYMHSCIICASVYIRVFYVVCSIYALE